MAEVALNGIGKRFGRVRVLEGIDLTIGDGEFVVLVGPSGCGKSTTLRIIAGLEEADEGTVLIGGREVTRAEPKDRNIAMVFQNYAIYPHMSVEQNIGFGLYTAKLTRQEKMKRVRETAAMLGLSDLLSRKPAQLSGGQRQRVAIGRAMVRNPAVFLFDEPLSNLDAQLRAQMRLEIKKLHQSLKSTIVFVTHDQVEAMTLADRIVVMRDGRILQIGTPVHIYRAPADLFVARFIGSPVMNTLSGRIAAGGGRLVLDGGRGAVPLPDGLGVVDQPIILGVRPEALAMPGQSETPAALQLRGRVTVTETLGAETLVHIDVAGADVVAKCDSARAPQVGAAIDVEASASDLHFFDARTEKALRTG